MTDLTYITTELNIAGETSLIIMLHIDGTINRKGSGSMEIDKDLFIGMTDTAPILRQLSNMIDEGFSQYLNHVYDDPKKTGKNSFVEIVLSSAGQRQGMKFIYGSESMGPPAPVVNFVKKAIELTDPWFNRQQKQVRKSQKKWWEIWK